MWIAWNDAFLSIVVDKNNSDRLWVRARRRIDLENVVGRSAEILETPERDYRFRASLSRPQLKELVCDRIDRLDYGNFKDSVRNEDLHDLYAKMWELHWAYGQSDPATRPNRRKADRSHHLVWGPGDIVHEPTKGAKQK